MSAASPTPSNMPPPNLKRPRPSGSGTGAAGGASVSGPSGSQGTTTGSRTKRRKPEGSTVDDSDKRTNGVAGKGKDDDVIDPSEVKTKIDFNELPVETLYKYLEYHDLLPRWDVSPWSEEPCTPPNQLYTLSSTAPIVPPLATAEQSQPSHSSQTNDPASNPPMSILNGTTINGSANNGNVNGADSSLAALNATNDIHDEPQLPQLPPSSSDLPTQTEQAKPPGESLVTGTETSYPVDPSIDAPGKTGTGESEVENIEDNFEPPTTRSKTAPTRIQNTPTPEPTPPPQIKRGVITLSDVYLAREVLAEKANNHWMKGLGGGQNKEGETIVNFLYKMKVGHGRLLRVYNPLTGTPDTLG